MHSTSKFTAATKANISSGDSSFDIKESESDTDSDESVQFKENNQ